MSIELRRSEANGELREFNLKTYRAIAQRKLNDILNPIAAGISSSGRVNLWGNPDTLPVDVVYPRLDWAHDVHSQLTRVLTIRLEHDPELLGYNFELQVKEKGKALGHERGTIIFTFSPQKPTSEERTFES